MWKFREIEPGIPERKPHEAEFFRCSNLTSVVIREFIQNALDARYNVNEISVRVSFGEEYFQNLSQFFNGLTKHISAIGDKNLHFPPDKIPYLVIEDYGTTGLDGDTEWAADSNFSKFWHGEGTSLKQGHHAGRWGLGKTTFHIASKIRSFWGLTVRIDDRQQLLMGKSLLKPHRIGNALYNYAGYYAKNNWDPIDDLDIIEEFKNCFHITRNTEQPGLSVVIPLPDDEITYDKVIHAIIEHYFYPILAGKLRVEVDEASVGRIMLEKNNLVQSALSLNWGDTGWQGVDVEEVLNFVQLSIQNTNLQELKISDPSSPKITEGSFDNIEEAKTRFRQGEICGFKIPLNIRPAEGSEALSYYTIYVRKVPTLKQALEFYVRSGILIVEMKKTLGSRPIIALFVAEDEPITRFLGDCETPAHTDWNERTEGFKRRYKNASRILRFIKNSMRQIVLFLDEPPQGRLVDFLKEIFSIPVPPEEREKEERKTVNPQADLSLSKKEPLFIVSKTSNGFTVTLNSKVNISFPFRAIVKVAYDTRRRNPLNEHEPFDFDLRSGGISITSGYSKTVSIGSNEMKIEITGAKFWLKIEGFDPNRDLVVDVKEK